MSVFRPAILLLVASAVFSACESRREPAPEPPPERPPEIAKILEDVNGLTALTWDQFQELAGWYQRLRAWPTAASRLLQAINQADDKLADALLLYRDLDAREVSQGKFIEHLTRMESEPPAEPWVKAAFIQYLTMTSTRVTPRADFPSAKSWAREYAEWLSMPLGKYVPENDLRSLRHSLRDLHNERYRWHEVIQASLFTFSDHERYTKPNAMWMAEMAQLAYKEKPVAEKQLERWGYDVATFRWFDDATTGTQGFAITNASRMVLAFRGTEPKRFADWITDLKFRRVTIDWAPGGVHRGFDEALEAVWEDVRVAVEGKRDNQKLYVTGHSLGAALAQLAAHRLENDGKPVTAAYSFGSPSVGNADFARAYDSVLASRTFPHINHMDFVTGILPRWLGFAPIATRSTWLFTDNKHTMDRLDDTNEELTAHFGALEEPPRTEAERRFDDALKDLRAADALLELSANQLVAATYESGFRSGRLADHKLNQYLFKLGCSILDKRWEVENERAGAPNT